MSHSSAFEQLAKEYERTPYRSCVPFEVRVAIANQRVSACIEASAEAALRQIRLDFAATRMRLGLRPYALRENRTLRLPRKFACPECGGALLVEVDEWSTHDGTPTAGGYRVMCEPDTDAELAAWSRDEDYEDGHRYWMSDWQHLQLRVGRWLVRNVRVLPC